MAYGGHQLIGSDLTDSDVLGAEVDAQRSCQTERHPSRFAVDQQGGYAGLTQPVGDQPGSTDCVRAVGGTPIGDQNEQRPAPWIADSFQAQSFRGAQQTLR